MTQECHIHLLKPQIILYSRRSIEDHGIRRDDQHKAVQGLQEKKS